MGNRNSRWMALGLGVGGGGGEVCTPVDQIDGNVAQDATFTHPADGVVAWDVDTRPSDSATRVLIRAQDADNAFWVGVASGGNYSLWERVAGSDTNRASAGSAVQDGDRVQVVMSGNTITGYVNGVQKWAYASATNYATETGGIIGALNGATLSDLKTWALACRGEEGV